MAASFEPLATFNTEPDWNAMNLDVNMRMDSGDSGMGNGLDMTPDIFEMPKDPINPNGDFFSQELLALGLQEPLPPQDVMDELYVWSLTVFKFGFELILTSKPTGTLSTSIRAIEICH